MRELNLNKQTKEIETKNVNWMEIKSFNFFFKLKLKKNVQTSHTFIINSNVLNTINIIIKYSNGVDTTIRQILYLKLFRLLGIYRSKGRALIVKSIQDFCRKKKKKNYYLRINSI